MWIKLFQSYEAVKVARLYKFIMSRCPRKNRGPRNDVSPSKDVGPRKDWGPREDQVPRIPGRTRVPRSQVGPGSKEELGSQEEPGSQEGPPWRKRVTGRTKVPGRTRIPGRTGARSQEGIGWRTILRNMQMKKICHYFYNLCSKASEKTCYAKYFRNVLFFVPNSGILFCVVYTIVKVEQSKYVRAQKVKAQSPLLP